MIYRKMFLCMWVLSWAGSGCLKAADPLDTLDGLVKTWTGLRQAISTEKREWKSQKVFLESETSLLEKEIASLEAEIGAFDQFSNEQEQKSKVLLNRKQELNKYLESLKPLLEKMEAYITSRRQALPSSLKGQVEFTLKSRVVDRVQAVASALTALEDLQTGMQQTRELLEDSSGERREMEVVYLGLARAFAVSSTHDWAGVGKPGTDGWHWTSRPEIAGNVRRLMAILNQQQPAAFVKLPLDLSNLEEAKP